MSPAIDSVSFYHFSCAGTRRIKPGAEVAVSARIRIKSTGKVGLDRTGGVPNATLTFNYNRITKYELLFLLPPSILITPPQPTLTTLLILEQELNALSHGREPRRVSTTCCARGPSIPVRALRNCPPLPIFRSFRGEQCEAKGGSLKGIPACCQKG